MPASVFVIAIAANAVISPYGAKRLATIFAIAAAILAVLGLAAYRWELHAVRRKKRLRADFIKACPDSQRDPTAVELDQLWKKPNEMPDAAEVRGVIRKQPERERRVAWVVCFGVSDVPTPGDMRFEPEVFSPWRWHWSFIFGVSHLGFLSAFLYWYLTKYGLTLAGGWKMAVLTALLVALPLAGRLMWAYGLLFSPMYLRVAPGMVQILKFSAWRRKPEIRSYSMGAGTIAIMCRTTGLLGSRLSVSLIDEEDDEFSYCDFALWGLRDSRRAIERAWQVLLSTAPTPPLSDEELVG